MSRKKKAIILTYAPINIPEILLLRRTNIFKLAINQHAGECKPHARIIADYLLASMCRRFKENIISIRDRFQYETPRVETPDIEYKGGTIIAAVEYLIMKKYTDILIVGDNTVNIPEFQENVKKQINKLKHKANIYQYKRGNFNLRAKSITKFIKEK